MRPPNPQQQGSNKNPKLHSEADEQKQKMVAEHRLDIYFSGPRFRIILDDEPPTIGCTCIDINNVVVSPLPAANVALHRVEMADVPLAIGSSSGAKGSLHSLHLYVHAGDPHTKDKLVQYLEFMMGVEDRAGRLFKQGTATAVLSRGPEVSFFGYNGGTLKEITLEDLQRIPTA